MADNLSILDGGAVGRTIRATDNTTYYTPHHNVDSFNVTNPSSGFTRPGDTTAYASGDLVANDTTAGSVTALSWTVARFAAGGFRVRRARIKKSTTTTTNASFRLHLYGTTPTVTNGDNGVWLSIYATYIGFIDITCDKAFSDAAGGDGYPTIALHADLASGTTVSGLLEARAAYAPGNAEIFTVYLEVEAD